MRDGESVTRAYEVYRLERVSADGERADRTRDVTVMVTARRRLAKHADQWPK
ncbi:MAG: hypothetical protein CBARDMAM_5394 [uncultured Caballeronia sp.]|nr:MAG: hypothetical protein CBARDMAM_5394 [uncultured Caballeronia sp.]